MKSATRAIAVSALLIGLGLGTSRMQTPARAGQGAPPPTGPLLIEEVKSGIQKPRQVVVRDAKAFQKLWTEHVSNEGSGSKTAPQVDFQKYSVVAVFAGKKQTSGYRVEIGKVERKGKTAVIHATLWTPRPGASAFITSPCEMRAVPKLPPTIRFEVKEKSR